MLTRVMEMFPPSVTVLMSVFVMVFSGVSPQMVMEDGISRNTGIPGSHAVTMGLPVALPIETMSIASSPEDEQFPLMAFDSGGQLHYLYLKGKDVKSPVLSATNDMFTFSVPSTTLLTGDAWNPSMVIDDHDAIHLVWRERAQNGYRIMYSCSEDDGMTWSSPETIFFASGPTDPGWGVSTDFPRLAVGRNNTLHLVFTYDPAPQRIDPSGLYNGHPTLVMYARKVSGGWSTPRQIGDARDFARPVAVADDVVYVVWQDWTGDYNDWLINLAISYDDGATFTPQRKLVNVKGNSIHPDITVAPEGNVYLVFADDRTGRFRIYIKYSWDHGYTWSGDLALTTDIATALTPKVAVSPGGDVYVVWRDDRYANPQIFVKGMNENLDIISEMRVSTGAGSATYPQIRVDSFNNVHIMWQDDSSGNLDVMYATTRLRIDHQVSNMVSFINSLPDDAFTSTPAQVKNTLGNKLAVVDKDLDRIQGYISGEKGAMESAQASISSLRSSISTWIIDLSAVMTLMDLAKNASNNVTIQNYTSALSSLDQIKNKVSSLPASAFNGSKSQAVKEISGMVRNAKKDVQTANVKREMIVQHVNQPMEKIETDILTKMDGFMGGDPGDDWIILRSAQETMFRFKDQLKVSLDQASGGTGGNVYIYGVKVEITGNSVTISWYVNWGGGVPVISSITVKDSSGAIRYSSFWKPPNTSYFTVTVSLTKDTYDYDITVSSSTGGATYHGRFAVGVELGFEGTRFEPLTTVDRIYVQWRVRWGPLFSGGETYLLYRREGDPGYSRMDGYEVNPNKWPGLYEAWFYTVKQNNVTYQYQIVAEGWDTYGAYHRVCLPSCTDNYRLITGMQIWNLHVENIGSRGATIVWETNYDTGGVHEVTYYPTGGTPSRSNAISEYRQGVYVHKVSLVSLLPSTEYEFWVSSRDLNGHARDTSATPGRFMTYMEITDPTSYGWFIPDSYGSRTGKDVQRFEWGTTLDNYKDQSGHMQCWSDASDRVTYTISGVQTTVHGAFNTRTCRWIATSLQFTQNIKGIPYTITASNKNNPGDTGSAGGMFDAMRDYDGDGLTDGQEVVGWLIGPIRYSWGSGMVYVHSSLYIQHSDNDGLTDYQEWNLGTDPFNPDTDGEGSSDGTEVHFGTNPTGAETTGIIVLELVTDTQVTDIIYSTLYFRLKGYQLIWELPKEVDKGKSLSVSFVLGVLFPLQSSEEVDIKVDGYVNLGVAIEGKGKITLTPMGTISTTINIYDQDLPSRVYLVLTISGKPGKIQANEPVWAELARQLAPHQIYEDMNQEFPTSIFFDGDRDMSNNGLPDKWPDGSTRDKWWNYNNPTPTDIAINNALSSSSYKGQKYYSESYAKSYWCGTHLCANLNEFRRYVSTVYVHVLTADTNGDGIKDTIGIQYWFYYVFHDDPGQQPHPHDWWYFWVWYDMNNFKPTGVAYDFHHNLRAVSFEDCLKDGLHVRTYHDAGGHRVMYSPGDEADVMTIFSVALSMYGPSWLNQILDYLKYTGSPIYPKTIAEVLNPPNPSTKDKVIGLTIKGYWIKHIAKILGMPFGEDPAPWRVEIGFDIIPTLIADWDPSSEPSWKVEEFPHWVWVYGVEPYNAFNDRVKFTGDNIYSGAMADIWPRYYQIDTQWIGTHLPWRSNVSWAPNQVGSKAISSTEMVWKWKDYQYCKWQNPNGEWIYWYDWIPISPTIFTRYFDGSP